MKTNACSKKMEMKESLPFSKFEDELCRTTHTNVKTAIAFVLLWCKFMKTFWYLTFKWIRYLIIYLKINT